MNKNKTYYIGSGDFFGKCEASDKFHKEMLPLVTSLLEMLPLLSKLKIKETDIDKIANIVSEIYGLAYNDGYDNAEHEASEYC